MVNWITLEKAAEKVGVRKGTLCMWRNRKKFPFKTQGKGRSLLVSELSVDDWLAKNKGKTGNVGRPAKAGKKVGKKRGRKKTVGVRKVATTKSTEIVFSGTLDLETIQRFVTDIQGGCSVQISPARGGYALQTVK